MSQAEEHSGIIKQYLADINTALKDTVTEDILLLFKRLYDKEQSFAKKLQSTAHGREVYLKFIQKIVDSKGGIKIAKSYFRARQSSFIDTVNEAIKTVTPKLMYPVPINYRFCCFAIDSISKNDQRLHDLLVEIKALREEIINKHLYLAINRAKVHKKSAFALQVEFEDLIQIANESLIVAVDKYVMDDESSSFHSMAIGRMLATLITEGAQISSATIGQHAQKKLYQIRKLIQKMPNISSEDISKALDIAEEEINDLIAATSYKSLDDTVSVDSDVRLIDVTVTEQESPEDVVANKDLILALRKSFDVLSIIEKKVLVLKGVKIDGFPNANTQK